MRIEDHREDVMHKLLQDETTGEEFSRKATIRWNSLTTTFLDTGEVKKSQHKDAELYIDWIAKSISGKKAFSFGKVDFEDYEDAMLVFLRFETRL